MLFTMPLTKILILVARHTIILCSSCLRYSSPLKSKYAAGIRYCEHCDNTLERAKEKGKVIFVFGNYNIDTGNRRFILKNPDFSDETLKEPRPIDVSEVYIDTKTADHILLMQLITYVINYPPKHGVKSIKIFYKGNLDDLGGNLRNLLKTKFKKVARKQ